MLISKRPLHGGRILSVLLSAILLVIGSTAAKAETVPEMDAVEWAASVEPAVEQLRGIAKSDPNFATIKLDLGKRTVDVYRKGGASVVSYSAARLPAGARLQFRAAPLTSAETYELIDRIHATEAELTKQGIAVASITSEWTGPVTIGVRKLTDAARALPARFSDFGPDTVVVEENSGEFIRTNRDFDVEPFIAGAHIVSSGNEHSCSSGFTGKSTGNGAYYMITAAHCVRTSDPRFWTSDMNGGGPSSSFIGQATVVDSGHDIAYIRVTPDAFTVPSTWDGPIYPKVNQFAKTVNAMQHPSTAMTNVCTSGAFSGARCYASIKGGGLVEGMWLWWADSNNGTQIMGDGDSGGPVFRPNGGNNVAALGAISGSYNIYEVPNCGGDVNFCFSRVYFSDVYTEAYLNHDIDLRM